MARCGFTFDQCDTASLASQRDGNSAACDSTAEDQYVFVDRCPMVLERANWSLLIKIMRGEW